MSPYARDKGNRKEKWLGLRSRRTGCIYNRTMSTSWANAYLQPDIFLKLLRRLPLLLSPCFLSSSTAVLSSAISRTNESISETIYQPGISIILGNNTIILVLTPSFRLYSPHERS